MEEDLILSKAELVSGGAVSLPKGYRPPVKFSRSTAGPGAGNRSLVFSFNGMRVKKNISDDGEFLYDPESGTISKGGKLVAEDVSIVPAEFHCPEQAFFNLDQRCRFDCLFCSSPLLKVDATQKLTDEKIIELIKDSDVPIKSIALTSGISDSVSESADRMIAEKTLSKKGAEGIIALMEDFDQVLGILPEDKKDDSMDSVMQILIDVRAELRKKKVYDLADMIRDRLTEAGIQLEDSAEGVKWKRI